MYFVDVWGKHKKGFSQQMWNFCQNTGYSIWIQKFFPLDFCKNGLNFYTYETPCSRTSRDFIVQSSNSYETPCCCTSIHFNFFVWDTLYQYMQIFQSQSINPYETPCSCTSRHFKVNQSFHSVLGMEHRDPN